MHIFLEKGGFLNITYGRVKARVYEIFEVNAQGDLPANAINLFIVALIVTNIAAIILETLEGIHSAYASLFSLFDVFSVIVFTVEYSLRLWACTVSPRYARPLRGRLGYATSAYAIIDILAILPFYLPMIIPFDLRVLRMLRLVRLARLFKLARYSDSMKTMSSVMREKKEDIVVALFIGSIALILSSTLMYYAEHDVQPDKFASIPDAMWWGIVTLATIGYGDVIPVTPVGKFIGVFTALIGIGVIAIPAGIVGSAFVEEMQKKREKRVCPHCGKRLDEKPGEPIVQEMIIKK